MAKQLDHQEEAKHQTASPASSTTAAEESQRNRAAHEQRLASRLSSGHTHNTRFRSMPLLPIHEDDWYTPISRFQSMPLLPTHDDDDRQEVGVSCSCWMTRTTTTRMASVLDILDEVIQLMDHDETSSNTRPSCRCQQH
jgi:hypothetical protein